MKERELVSTILSRLGSILSQVPSVCSVDLQPEAMGEDAGRPDGALAVTLEGGAVHTLVVEAKGNAQPRNVRDAARRLKAQVEALRSSSVPHPSAVLGAPYVSERSAAILAEHGVGHLDLAGNTRLAFGPVYVERSGHANPHAVDRPFSSLFAPKTSRVARALLAHPARVWRLQELADELDVSLGLVAKAKASLLDGEYARDSPDGLALADPDGLLDAWLVADRRRPKPRGYYSLDSVSETERRIADAARASGARAALTSFSGAERVAPRPSRALGPARPEAPTSPSNEISTSRSPSRAHSRTAASPDPTSASRVPSRSSSQRLPPSPSATSRRTPTTSGSSRRHHPAGLDGLAAAIAAQAGHGLVQEALGRLADAFVSVDHHGPVDVARFLSLDPGTDDYDQIRQDAFQRVATLLSRIAPTS